MVYKTLLGLGPSFFEKTRVIIFNLSSNVTNGPRTMHVNITFNVVMRFKEIHQEEDDDLCGLTKGFIWDM